MLREIEVTIGHGKDVLIACREAGATDKSRYRWRQLIAFRILNVVVCA